MKRRLFLKNISAVFLIPVIPNVVLETAPKTIELKAFWSKEARYDMMAWCNHQSELQLTEEISREIYSGMRS